MRILVTGDRNWGESDIVRCVLETLPSYAVVIDGGAKGADTIAHHEAQKLGLHVESYPANWDTHGKFAGPIRNRQMLKDGTPDVVVFFHRNIQQSKGTKDMVIAAMAAGVPVYSPEQWLAHACDWVPCSTVEAT